MKNRNPLTTHTNEMPEPENTSNRVLSGFGTIEGDIHFKIRIIDSSYTTTEVTQKLLAGDLYAYFGDTLLYDEDRIEAIGIIDWGEDRGDFVVHQLRLLPLITRKEGW